MTDRDRLEILARVITQLVPERPDCGLSPESLLRLQRLTLSHLHGSNVCRAAAERAEADAYLRQPPLWAPFDPDVDHG